MGRSRAIRFEVRMRVARGHVTPMEYPTKHVGRANDENLATFVKDYNVSLHPGGVNAHLGDSARCLEAEVFDYRRGEVVARYKTPLFVVE